MIDDPELDVPPLTVHELVSGPRFDRIALNIVPTVSLQRPHTGVWNIVAKELEYLEESVRTTAVPILITGTRNVPPLPPQIDIAIGQKTCGISLQGHGPPLRLTEAVHDS
ncbi:MULTISPECIES: hypothetical protein [unclassified Streptomyces]|uniref:hypothetical protein n=1 Tax=unclassified Streptomyces TaxID=2593676 RepID=UPI0029AB3439|nr:MULTISPECIES: hypothetical protein [unclassified Streptomyces]MDX3772347.1 hypothetical protein [Streptomyces sp. AK08-01B]MDX3821845.1 hypothetical protein [Streptomyces sp. AK08-01A]